MFLKSIELKNFRNYKNLKLNFNKTTNLILGNNAQGKTNLLESIYYTSMGRSFKPVKDRDVIKFDEETSIIKANAHKYDDNLEISIILRKNGDKEIKKDEIKLKKISELCDNMLVVMFSPEDLKIVKEEPEKRRRFIDRELSLISPIYLDNLNNYKKLLFQRNNYLKEENIDEILIDVLDKQIVNYGYEVIKYRDEFIKKLQKYVEKIHSGITSGKEEIKLVYKPNVRPESKEEFEKILKEDFYKDRKNAVTSRGPHRDDIEFLINKIDVRKYGSQGQQRTCALSVRLAELSLIEEETGESAILLLDDVMSELDLNRQEYLIKTFENNQIFITATELSNDIIARLNGVNKIFIKNGKVIEGDSNDRTESYK